MEKLAAVATAQAAAAKKAAGGAAAAGVTAARVAAARAAEAQGEALMGVESEESVSAVRATELEGVTRAALAMQASGELRLVAVMG